MEASKWAVWRAQTSSIRSVALATVSDKPLAVSDDILVVGDDGICALGAILGRDVITRAGKDKTAMLAMPDGPREFTANPTPSCHMIVTITCTKGGRNNVLLRHCHRGI